MFIHLLNASYVYPRYSLLIIIITYYLLLLMLLIVTL